MRETVSEKIRQNFNVKSSPNLFWQEIRQIDRPQSRNSRPLSAFWKYEGAEAKINFFYAKCLKMYRYRFFSIRMAWRICVQSLHKVPVQYDQKNLPWL
jgi:hypothetical protein